MSKNVLYLEDHLFFANVLIKRLVKNGYSVTHCTTYADAVVAMDSNKKFDVALLDVVLTNGKTGIHFAEKYENKFNKILFITGCRDLMTLESIKQKNWYSVSKLYDIWKDLTEFLSNGKELHISLEEAC